MGLLFKRKAMRFLYTLAIGLLFSTGILAWDDTPDAIYVWVDGSSVCYRLEAEPVVKFQDNKAVLYLDGAEVLSLDLKERGDLKIVFGLYEEEKDPAGIKEIEGDGNSIPTKVSHSGKYIRGGKVIIVKDGKMYDTNGVVIKN
jgi:hypothetical protein